MTLSRIKARYDRLRLKYFMDAEAPLMVPPTAAQLRWSWLSPKSPRHGVTHLDEDREAESIELDPSLLNSRKFLNLILLHELTHMRNPRLNCGVAARAPLGWRAEQARLTALGAPLL